MFDIFNSIFSEFQTLAVRDNQKMMAGECEGEPVSSWEATERATFAGMCLFESKIAADD